MQSSLLSPESALGMNSDSRTMAVQLQERVEQIGANASGSEAPKPSKVLVWAHSSPYLFYPPMGPPVAPPPTHESRTSALWDDLEPDGGFHIRMQMKRHLVLAGGAERPFGQPHLMALQRYPHLFNRYGDILVADRAEQLALIASFARYRHGQAIECLTAGFCRCQVLRGLLFQLRTPLFEGLQVDFRRRYRKTRRNEIVASVA